MIIFLWSHNNISRFTLIFKAMISRHFSLVRFLSYFVLFFSYLMQIRCVNCEPTQRFYVYIESKSIYFSLSGFAIFRYSIETYSNHTQKLVFSHINFALPRALCFAVSSPCENVCKFMYWSTSWYCSIRYFISLFIAKVPLYQNIFMGISIVTHRAIIKW